MPLAATPNMGLVRPTELGDAGLWASLVNTIFSQIDLHDHSNGRGVRISARGLNIDGNVSWNSHRIQSASGVGFTVVSGSSGPDTHGIFVADGTGGTLPDELYWCTVDGDFVQLTSGTSLNVSAFTGGIVGDYSVVGAVVTYDSATQRYKFETSTADGHGWARLMTGGVRIGILNDTNNSHYIEHAVDAAIAGPYTVTWPAAAPGASGTLMQLNSSGAVTFGNTGLAASTFTGAVTLSGGIADNVTVASNKSITVQGTGDYHHGTKTIVVDGFAFNAITSSTTVDKSGVGCKFTGGTGVVAWCPVPVGRRFRQAKFHIKDNATGPSTLQCTAGPRSPSTDSASTTAGSSGAGSDQELDTSIIGAVTINSGFGVYLKVAYTAGSAQCQIYNVEVDFDYL